jgi:hypothetical protein
MERFKSYSFSRLINHNELEFFWVTGLTQPDQFDEFWDGRGHESVGYLVMHKNHKERKLRNLIYLIKGKAKDKDHIKRYIHRFAVSMTSLELESYDIEFILHETSVYQSAILDSELISYIRKIVGDDIPETLLNEISDNL